MSQKTTHIGRLRDKVTITRQQTADDGMGGVTITDETVCTTWASVTVPLTRDRTIGGADAEVRTHVVRVRQNNTTLTVNINDNVEWRNWRLTVKGVRPDGRQWIDLDCVVVEK